MYERDTFLRSQYPRRRSSVEKETLDLLARANRGCRCRSGNHRKLAEDLTDARHIDELAVHTYLDVTRADHIEVAGRLPTLLEDGGTYRIALCASSGGEREQLCLIIPVEGSASRSSANVAPPSSSFTDDASLPRRRDARSPPASERSPFIASPEALRTWCGSCVEPVNQRVSSPIALGCQHGSPTST